MQRSSVVEEWRQEGRLEERNLANERIRNALRNSVLAVVRKKFSNPVPEDIQQAVANEQVFGNLEAWIVLASTADTIDAFRAAIQPKP